MLDIIFLVFVAVLAVLCTVAASIVTKRVLDTMPAGSSLRPKSRRQRHGP